MNNKFQKNIFLLAQCSGNDFVNKSKLEKTF